MADIGAKPKRLLIGHDNSGLGAGWHLAEVRVKRIKTNGVPVSDSPIVVFKCG